MLKKLVIGFLGIILVFHILFVLISSVYVLYLKYNNPKTTPLMEYRKRELGIKDIKHTYVPLKRIPTRILRMVLIAEDYNFYRHKGIDIEGIFLAINKNLKVGNMKYYGGSTISQQTARTMFLLPKKSFFRKYLELIITMEMELILGKDRIIELYLNYAEWGKGIFGIASASKHFFKKDVGNLSFEEAVRLVAVLPNPRIYSPFSISKLVENRVELIKRYYND
ncbi:MAG: monofunctional biosynthetic peptidoglycan transglycosylase [Brevinematales bacterium]|nr:monofunctional biosynthetic peptidoglycan transglycosylase [Brevinematales bacterium]